MCPHFLVGDLSLHEAGPVIDRVLRAAMDFNPDTVDPGLVGQNRDYLVAEVEPGAIEAVLDLVQSPRRAP